MVATPWAHGLGLSVASAADTASASNEDQGALAEIVVTAQKRAENLQDVPIAISTVSGDQLAAVAATVITAIADMTPRTANDYHSGITGAAHPRCRLGHPERRELRGAWRCISTACMLLPVRRLAVAQ